MNEINAARRTLLKGLLAVLLPGSALLVQSRVVWAAWPEQAFSSKSVDAAMNALFEGQVVTDSDEIMLKAPDIAETGAAVPISVKTALESVESISIIVEKNPNPLAASFQLSAGTHPEVSTRIKMAETSAVIVVVKASGKLYSTRQEVKVTIGGCGG